VPSTISSTAITRLGGIAKKTRPHTSNNNKQNSVETVGDFTPPPGSRDPEDASPVRWTRKHKPGGDMEINDRLTLEEVIHI